MMKFDIGFLFDLDGVLMNTKPIHFQAWQNLAKEEAQIDMDYEGFEQTFGLTNKEILAHFYKNRTEDSQKIGERKEELFRECLKANSCLIEGMQPFLEEVKKAGIARIIASNTPVKNLQFFLKETILGNYFDQFVSGEEVKAGKPAPDVFLEAAKRIHKPINKTIVFEDSRHGLVAAKRAGSIAIALETTSKEPLLFPRDLLFKGPRDLHLEPLLKILEPLLKESGPS